MPNFDMAVFRSKKSCPTDDIDRIECTFGVYGARLGFASNFARTGTSFGTNLVPTSGMFRLWLSFGLPRVSKAIILL